MYTFMNEVKSYQNILKKMSYICMIKINRLKKILILYNLTVR